MSQPAEQRGRLFALLLRQPASNGDGTARRLFSVSATGLTFCDRLSLSGTLAIFPGNKRDPTNPLRAMCRKASPVTAPRRAKRLHSPSRHPSDLCKNTGRRTDVLYPHACTARFPSRMLCRVGPAVQREIVGQEKKKRRRKRE